MLSSAIGDRLAGLTKYDGQTELMNLPEQYLIPVPEGVDPKTTVALILLASCFESALLALSLVGQNMKQQLRRVAYGIRHGADNKHPFLVLTRT